MSDDKPRVRLPVHVGFYILGCAAEAADGVALPVLIGPMIEGLSEVVERVTVVAHDPPRRARSQDEVADYVARPSRGNLDVLSVGPVGTWRDHVSRRRRVGRIVRATSGDWDVAIVRLPNRRADTLIGGNRCPRIVSVVLGYAPGVARVVPAGVRKVVQRLVTAWTEVTLRAILRASGLVVFNSREAAAHYTKQVPQPVEIPWSMRRARYSHVAQDRLTDGSAKIMLCARLTETKGVFEALDVFERLRAETLPNAHLHVIGDGDARGEMESRLAARGLESAATFHGWIPAGPDLFQLFREMDVMLHLSYAEAFPCVIWEALAHSILTVCTPVGGIPHELTGGEEVMYVPVGDVELATEAVRQLAANTALRQRLLQRGYARACTASVEAIVDDLVDQIAATWPELRPAAA